jgi:hypothetical protein
MVMSETIYVLSKRLYDKTLISYFVCKVCFHHFIIIEVRFKQNIRTNKWNHRIDINHRKFRILDKSTFVELRFIAITLQAQEKNISSVS